jgi:hypothetical protein
LTAPDGETLPASAALDGELLVRQRLKADFPYYAENCLKIRTKAGEIKPLKLNRVQRHIRR